MGNLEKIKSSVFRLWILQIGAIALLYYAMARLGLLLAFQHTNASPVWPPSGFAFAIMLLLGYRIAPGIFLGAFSANLVTFLSHDHINFPTVLGVSMIMGLGNTLEAVAGTFIYHKFIGQGTFLNRIGDVFRFVFIAVLMCLVSSAIGPTVACLLGIIPWNIYKIVWFTWWMGDLTGVLTLTPLFLVWMREYKTPWKLQNILRLVFSLMGLFLLCQFIFGRWLPASIFSGQAYLLIPFLLLIVFISGPREITLTAAVISGVAIFHTINGFGPFLNWSLNTSLLSLQAFIAVVEMTMLSLTGALEERRIAERLLVEKTQELERSNSELEQFAHVVSHDLQEPIRSIISFSQLFIKKFSGQTDPQMQKYLDFIMSAAKRMQMLIEGLLQFSRLGREELTARSVSFEKIVKEAMENLRELISERKAVITFENLPTLPAHPAHMVQLFQNLIGNSIKYCDNHPPKIQITSEREGNVWLFSVRDNGIGIDPKYSEQIFIIFERLHNRDKYPGTGIGLTICKRIVERHGGKIWVESNSGQGAVFKFTLPS